MSGKRQNRIVHEYWVDGFNVLHRIDGMKSLLDADPAKARETLIRMIAPSASSGKDRWIVIFDGKRRTTYTAPGPVKIVFTPNADEWIIGKLSDHPIPRMVTIVTSDEKDIGMEARRMGAKTISSDNFVKSLKSNRKKTTRQRTDTEKPPLPTPEEVAEWIDIFESD